MSTARRRRPRLVRIVRARPRLFLSAAVGLVVTALLMASTSWPSARCLLVFAELGTTANTGGGRQFPRIMLATLTIVLSWAFIHTIFALHYAHELHDEDAGGGMVFPGGEAEPTTGISSTSRLSSE